MATTRPYTCHRSTCTMHYLTRYRSPSTFYFTLSSNPVWLSGARRCHLQQQFLHNGSSWEIRQTTINVQSGLVLVIFDVIACDSRLRFALTELGCHVQTPQTDTVCHFSAQRLNESWPPFYPRPTFSTPPFKRTHTGCLFRVLLVLVSSPPSWQGFFTTRTWNEVNSITMTF